MADVVDHKNYKYVICKTESKIPQKPLIGKTITVHIAKEVSHGEKTILLGSNSSCGSTNFAATVQPARANSDLPSR